MTNKYYTISQKSYIIHTFEGLIYVLSNPMCVSQFEFLNVSCNPAMVLNPNIVRLAREKLKHKKIEVYKPRFL